MQRNPKDDQFRTKIQKDSNIELLKRLAVFELENDELQKSLSESLIIDS